MRRPSTRTMVLGHPVVVVPATIASLGSLYVTWLGGNHNFALGLFSFVVMVVVGRATSEASAYKQWKRDWDAMAGEAPASGGKLKGCFGFVLAALLVTGGLVAASTYPDQAGNLLLPVGAPLAILIALVAWLRARRRRPARAKPVVPVQVVASRTMPVPTLEAAYADLPEHLRHLIKRPGT